MLLKARSYLNKKNQKPAINLTASELVFYLGTGAYFTLMFLATTMFADILPLSNHLLRNMFRFTCYGLIIVKMLMAEKYTVKRIILYVVLAIPMLLCYRITGYIYELDLFMFIVGARGIKADRIVRLYFYLSVILIAITFFSVAAGIIENRVFIRTGGTAVRNSVGFIYPTDFGARIFYTLLAFCYLVGKRFNLALAAIFLAISAALLIYCDARLDAVLIFIMGVLFLIYARTKLFTRKSIQIILQCSVPFFFFLSYFVTMSYKRGGIFLVLNELLSKRLMYGYYNVRYIGLNPFGHYIYQQGHGALVYSVQSGYNFVDCGYLQSLLEYGYILMFFVLVMFVLISRTAIIRGRYEIAIIVFMVGLTTCIDHHFLEFWYDPFPLLIFSYIPYASGYKKKEKKAVKTEKDGGREANLLVKPNPKGLTHSHDVWGQLAFLKEKG